MDTGTLNWQFLLYIRMVFRQSYLLVPVVLSTLSILCRLGCICVCVPLCAFMHVCVSGYLCVYVMCMTCVYISQPVHKASTPHSHTHTHTHIHIHAHTHHVLYAIKSTQSHMYKTCSSPNPFTITHINQATWQLSSHHSPVPQST